MAPPLNQRQRPQPGARSVADRLQAMERLVEIQGQQIQEISDALLNAKLVIAFLIDALPPATRLTNFLDRVSSTQSIAFHREGNGMWSWSDGEGGDSDSFTSLLAAYRALLRSLEIGDDQTQLQFLERQFEMLGLQHINREVGYPSTMDDGSTGHHQPHPQQHRSSHGTYPPSSTLATSQSTQGTYDLHPEPYSRALDPFPEQRALSSSSDALLATSAAQTGASDFRPVQAPHPPTDASTHDRYRGSTAQPRLDPPHDAEDVKTTTDYRHPQWSGNQYPAEAESGGGRRYHRHHDSGHGRHGHFAPLVAYPPSSAPPPSAFAARESPSAQPPTDRLDSQMATAQLRVTNNANVIGAAVAEHADLRLNSLPDHELSGYADPTARPSYEHEAPTTLASSPPPLTHLPHSPVDPFSNQDPRSLAVSLYSFSANSPSSPAPSLSPPRQAAESDPHQQTQSPSLSPSPQQDESSLEGVASFPSPSSAYPWRGSERDDA